MRLITLRLMTKTVANPKYDGRARHGIEAIKAFKEGTLCTIDQGDEADRCGYVFYAGSTHLISLAYCAELIAASEPKEPSSFAEFKMSIEDKPDSHFLGDAIIEELVKQGRLTIPEIRNFNITLFEKPHPDQST